MSLIGNVAKPPAKSVLVPVRLTAAASATDGVIHREMFGSGVTTLIISNEKINYITKRVKSSEESDFLINWSKRTKIYRNVIRHVRC